MCRIFEVTTSFPICSVGSRTSAQTINMLSMVEEDTLCLQHGYHPLTCNQICNSYKAD